MVFLISTRSVVTLVMENGGDSFFFFFEKCESKWDCGDVNCDIIRSMR